MNDNIFLLVITEGSYQNLSCSENINKLLKLILSFTNELNLVTYCNKDHIKCLNDDNIILLNWQDNSFVRIFIKQLRIAKIIFTLYKNDKVNTILFAFGQDLQLIPLLVAKLLRLKCIIRSDGRPSLVLKDKMPNRILFLFEIIEKINYYLADILLTESDFMVINNNFEVHNALCGPLYVDLEKFNKNNRISNRNYDVGFVGRLESGKGFLNFIEAVDQLNNKNILIIGDGSKKDEIDLIQKNENLNVDHINWIENRQLPFYFNQLKILVLPSFKEGLPNTILEAMGCGCVVIATPVGGIKGIITDKDNGFIINDNSPNSLAHHIINVLSDPKLEKISDNAMLSIMKEYSYETSKNKWKNIFLDMW